MSAKSMADGMGWSGASQSRLEKAESKTLSPLVMDKLCELLKVTPKFLSSPPPAAVTLHDLRFRAPKSTSLTEKQFLAEFLRAVGELSAWLDEKHNLPPVRVPRLPATTDPVQAAAETRDRLGLPRSGPIERLATAIESHGVVVVMRSHAPVAPDEWDREGGGVSVEAPERGERHFGASAWTGTFRDRPVIVMRSIASWERTRWTLAHELGHLALHHGELPKDAELQASRFASELIAPARDLAPRLPKHLTLSQLLNLKIEFGISLGALIRHLDYASLISPARVEALRQQLYTRVRAETGRTWGAVEPGHDAWPLERPQLLGRWLDHTVGTSSPPQLEALHPQWPASVIRPMLSPGHGQTTAIGGSPKAPSDDHRSNVVQLARL